MPKGHGSLSREETAMSRRKVDHLVVNRGRRFTLRLAGLERDPASQDVSPPCEDSFDRPEKMMMPMNSASSPHPVPLEQLPRTIQSGPLYFFVFGNFPLRNGNNLCATQFGYVQDY